MVSPKIILSTFAFVRIACAVPASSVQDSMAQSLASSLGVTTTDLTELEDSTDLSKIDATVWTNPLGTGFSNVTSWSDDIKTTFLEEMKTIVDVALHPTVSTAGISKREKGSDSAAARAQVNAAVAKARAEREASNRRRLLQCNSGTQTQCTVCASICSAAWISGSGLCAGTALGAEVGSAGTLTPAVGVTLASCLGVAGSLYAACIVKCIG
ncbi:hypothetical protein DL764_007035 [Monosporascus ibericus]|uniref:Uncharacterized protein n=1 Tax=Monosporascus ibericus TaxID=155417 RepID=A0A4Q4T696_9PEZI|nr:hypothetical protein DL764_007035 [Monosporascus ibericus]